MSEAEREQSFESRRDFRASGLLNEFILFDLALVQDRFATTLVDGLDLERLEAMYPVSRAPESTQQINGSTYLPRLNSGLVERAHDFGLGEIAAFGESIEAHSGFKAVMMNFCGSIPDFLATAVRNCS